MVTNGDLVAGTSIYVSCGLDGSNNGVLRTGDGMSVVNPGTDCQTVIQDFGKAYVFGNGSGTMLCKLIILVAWCSAKVILMNFSGASAVHDKAARRRGAGDLLQLRRL